MSLVLIVCLHYGYIQHAFKLFVSQYLRRSKQNVKQTLKQPILLTQKKSKTKSQNMLTEEIVNVIVLLVDRNTVQ